MRIDLFELIEGLFSGLVFFFYNVGATIAQLIRRPFRGPLRLYRAYQDKRRRQVGSLTLLFIAIIAIFVFHPFILADAPAGDGMLAAISAPPDFGSRSVWVAILAALATIVLIDAPLRMFLHFRGRGSVHRRGMILSSYHYGMAWILAAFAVLSALEDLTWDSGDNEVVAMLPALLLVAAAMPAWVAVRHAFRRRRRPGVRRSSGQGWWAVTKRLLFGLPGTLLLVVYAFLALGFGSVTHASLSRAGTTDEFALDVAVLRCDLAGARPRVDAVLRNVSGKTILFRPETDMVLMLAHGRLDIRRTYGRFKAYALQGSGGPDRPVLLAPGETHVLTAFPSRLAREDLDSRNLCLLHPRDNAAARVDEDAVEFTAPPDTPGTPAR